MMSIITNKIANHAQGTKGKKHQGQIVVGMGIWRSLHKLWRLWHSRTLSMSMIRVVS